MSCPVCVESYNRTTHAQVDCSYCSYVACRACYETYLLQNHTSKCMSCYKEMTREMIVKRFTRKFVSTQYKEHRERCLLEQEKAMLPATQPIVEQLNENEKIKTEIANARSQICALYEKIRNYEDRLHFRNPTSERKTFIRKCPNPNCRGFLSSQWKCNLCERKTCRECNECITDPNDEHKCDPANVETAKLLAKDSKPCPNCGEMIFKIDGCSQIWCTQCHTAFDWRTGQIESGSVHNPHYFEWLQKRNQMDDNPMRDIIPRCGREIDHYFVRQLTRSLRNVYSPEIIRLCRSVIHFREVELPRFRTDRFNDNQDLRILFLRNRIDEQYFRVTLQKREKARNKKEDLFRLFSMMIQCITEIIYRYEQEYEVDNASKYVDEIYKLLEYVNECLKNISSIYSSRRYYVSKELILTTNPLE